MVLRLAQFLHFRELWFDEACLAVDLINKSFSELLGFLECNRLSPLAYLFWLKGTTLVFGEGEYALRSPALVAGLGSVLLFYLFVRQTALQSRSASESSGTLGELGRRPTRVSADLALVAPALFLFAINKHAIYYSAEVRHYSLAVAFTCLLYWLTLRKWPKTNETAPPLRKFVYLGITGAAAVWFALASIFVLAAIGTVEILRSAIRRDWRGFAMMAVVGLLWAGSFSIHMNILSGNLEDARHTEALGGIVDYLSIPIPPTNFAEMIVVRDALERIFYIPGGFTYIGLSAFVFLLGCISFWFRRKYLLLLLLLPLGMVLMATAIDRYPFRNQYLLFFLPCQLVLIAEGIAFFLRLKTRIAYAVCALLLTILLAQPFVHAMRVLSVPRTGPGGGYSITPLLERATRDWGPGDVLYAHGVQFASFDYYKGRYGFEPAVDLEDPLFVDPLTQAVTLNLNPESAPGGRAWIIVRSNAIPPVLADVLTERGLLDRQQEILRTSNVTLHLISEPSSDSP